MYLIDTNVLLDYPDVFEIYSGNILIPIGVIEELDRLKISPNGELAYKARRAIYHIASDFSITFDTEDYSDISVDNSLLKIAEKYSAILLTNDLNVIIKAKAKNISAQMYKPIDTDYTGIQYLLDSVDDNYYSSSMDKILSSRTAPMKMRENEYLAILNAETEETLAVLKNTHGRLELVRDNFIKSPPVDTILPRNLEQQCLIDLLENKDITIIAATGNYGTGKSYLLVNYALQELEKGNINKIVCVPNNSIVDNSRELGLLPGDTIDKELCYLGPILDLIGELVAKDNIQKGKMEIVPLSVIRGRSFENSIVIVNEAQNLTPEHIKLLIARCGEGTRIFFDGDIKQTDSSIFKNKNGLKALLQLAESEEFAPIFGTVRLKSIERSKTAQASEYLDSIFI